MAYDYTIPDEANLVRTTSGDLALMRANFVELAPLVSGTVVSGTAPSAAIRGFYLGDDTVRNRYFIQSDGTDVFRIQRNIGTEGSPNWENVLSIAQGTGVAPEFSHKVIGVDPTASGHLATKYYVDNSAGSQTLSGLTDTAVAAAASGQILEWDGTDWANVNHAHTLNDLTDVSLPSPASGEVLTYTGAQWEAASGAGGGGSSTLSGLTDTVVTAPTSGEMLEWDGTDWVNVSAPAGTLSGLTDTLITSPAADSVLTWNGSAWIDGAAPAQTLSGLTDTSVNAPTSGQHLAWDGTDWANVDMPSGNRVICVLSGAQVQDIPQAVLTTFSGDEVPFNQGGFTVASGSITIPDAITRVDIQAQANWESTNQGTDYGLEIMLNGAPLSGLVNYNLRAVDHRRKSTTDDTSAQNVLALDVPVASGDVVTMVVFQDGVGGGLELMGGAGLLVRESKTGGAAGGGGGGSSTLAGLTDTNITSPASGAVLTWDGSSDWIDGSAPAQTLSGLTDTTITAPVSGGTMEWDGSSAWIDAEPVATKVASGVGLVESFDLAVESVASGDSFTISLYAFYPYDVVTVRGKTTAGTCDLIFTIEGTAITGLSGVTVSGTETGWDSSAAESVALGNTLAITVDDATTCSGLLLSVKTERT